MLDIFDAMGEVPQSSNLDQSPIVSPIYAAFPIHEATNPYISDIFGPKCSNSPDTLNSREDVQTIQGL